MLMAFLASAGMRLTLFLSPGNTIIVADASVDARWLELVKVSKGSVEFLLCALQVFVLNNKRLRLILFLSCLVLDINRFLRLVNLRICHKSIVLLPRRCLR